MSQELTIKNEANELVEKAKQITITNEKEKEDATLYLSRANKALDNLIAIEEEITAPANLIIKNERARWAVTKKDLKEIIDSFRIKLGAYQTLKLKLADEEAKKISDRIAPGKGNLSFESGVAKIAAIEVPTKRVSTDEGSLSFRTDIVLKITNDKLIPREFLIVDEKALLLYLKSGKTVKGAELDTIQVPINHRK